jgi:crotonobetainyl-CoA:carnitine CoA-transferase CaiB-like acyl-CoA transferase
MAQKAQGPLAGIRIVELGSIGPGPFCCMLLADTDEVLRDWGFSAAEIDALRAAGAARQC